MNHPSFNAKQPLHMQIYGKIAEGLNAIRTDAQGRPVLWEGATQTIAATSFNVRDLNASDVANITALNFDIRNLESSLDAVRTGANPYAVASNTATLVLGGTTVLTVDTRPYSNTAFLVQANLISLLTTVFLQLAPVNSSNYYTTVDSATGLILGGEYILLPTMSMRYARIYATGVGSILTAYFIGQV